MRILDLLRKGLRKLFKKEEIASAAGVNILMSSEMEDAIELWTKMYKDCPAWKSKNTKTLNVPASLSSEVAKTTCLEMKVKVSGSARAEYIDKCMRKPIFSKMRNIVEYMIAKGGVVVKPYVDGEKIEYDIIQANHFFPTRFDSSGNILAAIFDDFEINGDVRYTRLEYHELMDGKYTIKNKAFKKSVTKTSNGMQAQDVGKPCSLTEVDRWAEIEPEVFMEDVEHVFFSYGKTPWANHIDTESPLGVSIFSKAVEQIEEADKQWTRILREYKEKEVVVQALAEVFDEDRDGNPILPEGDERRFEVFDVDAKKDGGIKDFLQTWSPDIRDTSLFNGLNKMLQRIEFLCGVSYGTISDPIEFEKTATEILSSKQRMYSTVTDIQDVATKLLEDIVFVTCELVDLYEIYEDGEAEVSCEWDDSIMTDSNLEYQRRWSWVQAGKMRLEAFYAWYFGCTEEEAGKYIPENKMTYPEDE